MPIIKSVHVWEVMEGGLEVDAGGVGDTLRGGSGSLEASEG